MYRRILHLIHTPRHSGAEILVRDLCLLHRAKGIDTAIASFAPSDPDFLPTVEMLEKARVQTYLPENKCSGGQRVAHFTRAMRDFRPDIIYAHSVLPALYGRRALPFFGTKPCFVSVLHSATNDDYHGLKLWLSELILARRSNRIFAVSEEGARSYIKRIPHHRPVDIVPNGTNISKIHEALEKREFWRAQYGVTPKTKLILQVGRISLTKQQRLSLDALAPLLKENPDIKLWFAGLTQDAAYEHRLREEIARLSLGQQVELLGGREDIPMLLAAADLYLMPSLIEAHSIAMIEAQASGLPIIATDIAAFKAFSSYLGVRMISLDDKEMLASFARELLQTGGRYERDMSRFDMNKVASVYGGYSS